MASDKPTKLAVLIDADNAQPGIVEALLDEVAKYGTAHVKRAYGDWTGNHLNGWKDHLLTQSIQPMQQFGYTRGKNATDSAMIIDAMDLLYSGKLDGFCIVSSDSDFTRLAGRIRESGLIVYGFGETKTPKPFVAACDKFIYTDVLKPEPESEPGKAASAPKRKTSKELRGDTGLVNLLRNAMSDAADDGGWASLGAVGSQINKRRPEFDSRNYGYAKLSGLIGTLDLFETEERQVGNGKHMFVRLKKKSPADK